jgi:hypothetical protein
MEEPIADRDSRSEYWDRNIKGKVSRFPSVVRKG